MAKNRAREMLEKVAAQVNAGALGEGVTATLEGPEEVSPDEMERLAAEQREGGIEQVSMNTDDRIVDAAMLIHQALHCKEMFTAFAKKSDELAKKAGKEARKACGFKLSGEQTMLFDNTTKAGLRMEFDMLDLLREALDAALTVFDPEDEE